MDNTQKELEKRVEGYVLDLNEQFYKRGKEPEWLRDCLEIKKVDNDGEFAGFRFLLAYGGPTITLDTEAHEIRGSWGLDEATIRLDNDVCEALNDYYGGYC